MLNHQGILPSGTCFAIVWSCMQIKADVVHAAHRTYVIDINRHYHRTSCDTPRHRQAQRMQLDSLHQEVCSSELGAKTDWIAHCSAISLLSLAAFNNLYFHIFTGFPGVRTLVGTFQRVLWQRYDSSIDASMAPLMQNSAFACSWHYMDILPNFRMVMLLLLDMGLRITVSSSVSKRKVSLFEHTFTKCWNCTKQCKKIGGPQKTIPKTMQYGLGSYKTMQNDSGLTNVADDLSVNHNFSLYLIEIIFCRCDEGFSSIIDWHLCCSEVALGTFAAEVGDKSRELRRSQDTARSSCPFAGFCTLHEDIVQSKCHVCSRFVNRSHCKIFQAPASHKLSDIILLQIYNIILKLESIKFEPSWNPYAIC